METERKYGGTSNVLYSAINEPRVKIEVKAEGRLEHVMVSPSPINLALSGIGMLF